MPPPNGSPIAALDPNIVVAQQNAQNAQAYAQLLRQQAAVPIDTNEMVSGRVVKVSPWLAMAKVLQGAMAGQAQQSANQQQADLAQRTAAATASLFAGSGAGPGASPGAVPPASPDAVAMGAALAQGAAAQPMTPDASGDGSMDNTGGVGPTVANAQRLGAVLAGQGGAPGDISDPQPTASQPVPSTPAPANTPGTLQMPGLSPQQSYAMYVMDPGAYMTELLHRSDTSTDLTKMMRAANIDPASPQGQALIQQNIAKQNNIPLQAGRPGAPMYDSRGNVIAFSPKVPDGAQPTIVNGQITGVAPLPGAQGVMQGNAYASAMGAAGAKPVQVWDPTANGGQGAMVFQTEANVAGAAGAQNPTPAVQGNDGHPALSLPPPSQPAPSANATAQPLPPGADPAVATMPPSIRAAYNAAGANPQQQLALLNTYKATVAGQPADFSSGAPNQNLAPPGAPLASSTPGSGAPTPMMAAPPLGAAAAADTAGQVSQTALQKKIDELTAAQASAPTVIARLHNIDQLANAAVTGPQQDRREYITGLLSLLPPGTPGLSGVQGNNYNQQTATDLLEKNSNQIVAAMRMGSSGGGSDALQTLLSGANPNVTMTPAAIHEAVSQLVANQQMNQAKASLLLPLQGDRNAAKYATAESQFNANADPRVWQYAAMLNAGNKPGATAFIQKNPDILPALKNLTGMGVLQ